MFKSPKNFLVPYSRLAFPAALAIVTFIIGYIHHRWFFPLDFHSDAAAMQVLAQAIVDEKHLLPRDFGYGNQLIMFRSSPFIALALACGSLGFDAYIIGSALSIAFWSVILYATLAAYTSDRVKSLVITLLFMIPMNVWDHDYVLGQQSHLSNIVLAACAVMLVHMSVARQQISSLVLAAGIVFMMAAEAPIRALLVLVPVVLTVCVYFGKRPALKVLGFLFVALVLGVLANKALQVSRPIGLNLFATMVFRSTGEIVDALLMIGLEMLGAISSLNIFTGRRLEPGTFIFYTACLSYLLMICAYAGWRAVALARSIKSLGHPMPDQARVPAPGHEFPGAVAVLGLITGALAVAILKPDTARHILWAGALMRMSFLLALYLYAHRFIKSRVLLTIALSFCALSASFWMSTLVKFNGNIAKMAEVRNDPPINAHILKFAKQLHIERVIGSDFWQMLVLNTTIPGISAGVLNLDGSGGVIPDFWLSRKSTFDPQGEVLYYLKDNKVDQLIREKLSASGGRELYTAEKESVWAGKPLWIRPERTYSWNGCQLPTIVGEPTADCHMQNRPASRSGFLTYGPYAELPAGKYTFELEYASTDAASTSVGEWDVAISAGSTLSILNSGHFKGSHGKATRTSGAFTIDRGQSGRVEIRTVSYPKSVLRIQKLRIVRYACGYCD